jgi:hypothetical protein
MKFLTNLLIPLALILTFPLKSQDVFQTPHKHESIAFIPNQGQFEGDFSHVIYTPRYAAFITDEGVTLGMSPIEELKAHHDAAHIGNGSFPPVSIFGFSWKFVGHNSDAQTQELGQTGPVRNYFSGAPDNWVSGLRDALELRKLDIYPGIDVLYKLHPRNHLEYDFIVEAGADPSSIEWEISGVDASIKDNQIYYTTPYGMVKEIIPEAYQRIGGKKIPVEVSFEERVGAFGFQVGQYNSQYDLIIDPVLVGATLTGTLGSNNYGHGAAYDIEGNIYSFGIGFGPGLPTSDGAIQSNYEGTGGVNAVINKFTPDASEQIYATYLGKDGTSPHSASANLFGELIVFGTTFDTDFPVTPGAFQDENAGGNDIFVSRLSDDGTSLIASTYLGGSGEDGTNPINTFGYDALRGEVSLDPNGDIFLASASESSDFPMNGNGFSQTLSGNSDGIGAKLSADLSILIWSTYVGGDGDDALLNVRIAENGDVVFSGSTTSDNYPTTAGVYQENDPGSAGEADATLIALSPNGSNVVHATYVGTDQPEQGYFMDLDNDNNVWIYGRTQGSEDWPITDGVFTTGAGDLFISKFNPALSEIQASTIIGAENFGFSGGGAL